MMKTCCKKLSSLKSIFEALLIEQTTTSKGWLNFKTGKYLPLSNPSSDLHFDFLRDNPKFFGLTGEEKLDASIFDVVDEKGWIAISYTKGYFSFRVYSENDKHVEAVQELIYEKHIRPTLVFIDVVDKKRSYQAPYEDFMQSDGYRDLMAFILNK